MKIRWRTAAFVAVAAWSCGPVMAQALPTGDPASAGVSRERLGRVMDVLAGEVAAGRIAGAVFAIERHGKVVFLQATGYRDKAGNVPMTTDSLFRWRR